MHDLDCLEMTKIIKRFVFNKEFVFVINTFEINSSWLANWARQWRHE
jgi:hypothetical protein